MVFCGRAPSAVVSPLYGRAPSSSACPLFSAAPVLLSSSGWALLGGLEGSLLLGSCHLLYPQDLAHEEVIFGY